MSAKNRIQWIAIFIGFLVWIGIYHLVKTPLIMPSVEAIGLAFVRLFILKSTIETILFTILRLILVLVLSAICGVLCGALASYKWRIEYFLRPYVTILRTIPVISIFVILIILFGFKASPLIVTFFDGFFLLFINRHWMASSPLTKHI